MAEIEAKFLIGDRAQADRWIASLRSRGLDVVPLREVDLVDRYLDTPDWDVFRSGWVYRWRDATGCRKVCLKSAALNGDVVQKREEMEQQVIAFPGNGHRVPPGPVAQRLRGVGQTKPRELFQVHNRRRLFHLRTVQGALIEVAIDRATITATVPARKSAPGRLEFEELELELKEGPEESLRELAETVRTQCGLLPARLSKFERGLQVVGLAPPPAHMRLEVRQLEESDVGRRLQQRPLGKKHPAIKLACRYLLEQYAELLCQEPRAWEGLDPEGVHQMRVATRRIRAALRAFQRVLPATPVKAFRREFKWTAAALGTVRDLDVYQENFRHDAGEIPDEDRACLVDYGRHLVKRRQQARQTLLDCLSSERYRRLNYEFREFLERTAGETPPAAGKTLSIGVAAARLIGKQFRRVLRDGRAIKPDSPDEALHALRIECKRLDRKSPRKQVLAALK
jgi:inorganic triphosphatase YgiF